VVAFEVEKWNTECCDIIFTEPFLSMILQFHVDASRLHYQLQILQDSFQHTKEDTGQDLRSSQPIRMMIQEAAYE